jgi:hypothetical protein
VKRALHSVRQPYGADTLHFFFLKFPLSGKVLARHSWGFFFGIKNPKDGYV